MPVLTQKALLLADLARVRRAFKLDTEVSLSFSSTFFRCLFTILS